MEGKKDLNNLHHLTTNMRPVSHVPFPNVAANVSANINFYGIYTFFSAFQWKKSDIRSALMSIRI